MLHVTWKLNGRTIVVNLVLSEYDLGTVMYLRDVDTLAEGKSVLFTS